MFSGESLGTLRTLNVTPLSISFSKVSTSSLPIATAFVTTTLPVECASDPKLTSLMSTPPSIAFHTS